ncbi:MAG: hypothetical protein JWP89_2630 [Schlesneria sp.]|nr:hypothetical protein [Schlesneria sp.]
MAMDVGIHTHYDDPNTIINPTILGMAAEINLGAWEGVLWNMLSPQAEAVDNFKYEIYDRSRTGLTGTVGNGSGTGWLDGSDTTDLAMNAAAIGILSVGDVVEVENEQVIVSSVDRSANTIDVFARGHAGTTGASHADTTAFTIIGKAINDTDLKNVDPFAERSGIYTNYTQTIVEIIEQTFTDTIQARKAFEQKPQLIREAMDRMFRRLALTAIKGKKSLGTASVPQTTAGILQQLADGGGVRTPLRYNASGLTSPETVLKNALISIWNNGGNPTHIALSPTNKRKFDPLMEQFIRTTRSEASVIGTDNGTAYQFQGKLLPFVQDQAMPDDRIEIVTMSKLHKGWRVGDIMRGPVEEPKNSSRELRYSMQGSFFISVEGVGVDHIDLYNVAI